MTQPSLGTNYDRSNQHLTRAIQCEQHGSLSNALQEYITALEYLMAAAEKETDQELKNKLQERIDAVLEHSEKIRLRLKELPPTMVASPSSETAKSANTAPAAAASSSASSSWFVKEKPQVQWDEVIGLHSVKQTITETFDLPLRFPSLYNGARKPWSTVLMYGPPGTGKTTIMKALATKLNAAAFFSVKSSDIISKYHGESERNISMLFTEARQSATDKAPVIIFIDEVESLCSERQGGGGDSAQSANTRIVTEFLQQVDGFASNNKNIFIVGATNLPWQLDEAMLRRFQKHIYVPLPNLEERVQIIKQFIAKNKHLLQESDFMELAQNMEGYSGSDMKDVIMEAVFCPIRELMDASLFFRHPQSHKWIPIINNLDDIKVTYGLQVEIKQMVWSDLSDQDIDSEMLPVTKSHILAMLQKTNPTASPQRLKQYTDWLTRRSGAPPPVGDLLLQ